MKMNPNSIRFTSVSTDLRNKAEELLKEKSSKTNPQLSEVETLKLIHELQVHQIELELQNEELILAKSQAESASRKYTELYYFAPSGYFTLYKQGKIVDLNLCGAQMLGRDRTRLKNSLFGLFVTDETKPVFNLFLKKIFAGKAKELCEVALLANGCSPVFVQLAGIVTENEDQCFITAIDITDHKKLEEARLESSEERYRILYENAKVGLYRTTPDGTILLANKALVTMLGYQSFEELARRNVEQNGFETPSQRKVFLEKIEQNGEVENLESTWIRQDRKPVFVRESACAIRDANGKTLYYDGTVEDITKRKHAEEALIESEVKYRALFETSLDGISLLDLNGKIIFANKQVVKLFGYNQPSEFIGLNGFGLIHPDDKPKMDLYFKEFITTGVITNCEVRSLKKDGSEFIGEYSATIIKNANGDPVYMMDVVRDITELKQVEEALRESEARYRLLINAIPDLIFRLDRKGVYLDYKAANEDLAFQTESIIGKNNRDVTPPEFADLVDEKIKLTIQTGEMQVFEYQLSIPNKGICDFDARMVPGSSDEVIVIVRDITERKKTEEKITMLAMAVENSADCIAITDKDYKIIYVNDSFCQVYDFTREEIVGQPISVITSMNNLPEVGTSLYAAMSRKEVWTGEVINKRKNGKDFPVQLSLAPVVTDQVDMIAVVGILRDVTERKQTEKIVRQSEVKFRTLFESANDAIFIMKGDSFVDCNLKTEQMFRCRKEDILNMHPYEFSPPLQPDGRASKEKAIAKIQAALNGTPQSFVWKHLTFDGTPFDAEVSLNRVVIDDEVLLQAIVRDITMRKHAEAEIKLKNKQLQKLIAEKDKFFSIIAHDLRSPFNSFLGFTEMMADDLGGFTMDEIHEFSLRMRDSALNLFRLLENLLLWARAQQGLVPFNPEVLYLLPVVYESIALLKEPARLKGIAISLHIEDDIKVFADSNMLQTIIRNLISNAIKFTPKGGEISISVTVTHDNTIEIAIHDTGIGMDNSMLENIFKLDVNTNRRGTEGEPSSGLGLMLCKEFVEKHGGKIRIESEETDLSAGKAGGTSFYFTIPLTF
ncbi:MAG: PAS domain-containing sensor histidine kinase [Bacteroidales bacterium]|nr:PAS domain-containing sensor histidine kinase [Bacteroidales bacterium]